MKRTIFVATLIFMLGFSFSSLMAASKGTVTVLLPRSLASQSPYLGKQGQDYALFQLVHQALVRGNTQTGEWEPWLAESYQLQDNKKDILVKLRKNARFHTGDPVTAHDIRFSWQQYMANNNVWGGQYKKQIEDIEVIDDYTLMFKQKRASVDWLRTFINMWISSKKYYEKVGKEKFLAHPVGSGSARFISRVTDDQTVVEAVENHWFRTPEFKKLVFRIVKDQATRLAMLETGEADLAFPIAPQDVKRLKKNKNVKIKTAIVPSYFTIQLNSAFHGDLLDKNLRLAVNYAINRQWIADKLFFGMAHPLYSTGSASEISYDPNLKYEYDPAKAKQLLKKSSYKKGTAIELVYFPGMPNVEQVFSVVQRNLTDIGITTKLQRMELGAARTRLLRQKKKVYMMLVPWPGRRDPNSRLKLCFLKGAPFSAYHGRDDMTELIKKQEQIFDPAERIRVLKKINQIHHTDPGFAALVGLNLVYATSERIDYTWMPRSDRFFNLFELKMLK